MRTQRVVLAVGSEPVDASAVTEGPVHLVRVFTTDGYKRVVARLSGTARSPDAAARVDRATATTADRLRTAGHRVEIHGRVTDRTTTAVADVADAVDAGQIVVADSSVAPDQLADAGWAVTRATQIEPQWFLTD